MTRRIALLWFATVLLSCGVRGGASALARVHASGVLRWGGDTQGGEPYVYEDPRRPGTLIGFEVDLAAAIARHMGVRAEFVQNDWANLIPSLERDTFDVVMNGLEITPARAGRVTFSRPYYAFALRLMARRDDPGVHDLASLRGHRVGTLANSQSWELLQRSDATPVPYDGVEEPYIDLERRRTDAVLLDDIIADRYGVPKPDLRVVGDVGTGYYAIATKPSDAELARAIDTALGETIRSGELAAILAHWHLDGQREDVLATWTAADTERVAGRDVHASFGLHHVALFLHGALVTMAISVGAMALAIPLGILLALARLFGGPVLARVSAVYVEVLRGTPVLLQLYLLYYGLSSVLRLDAYSAAVLGLGLNYAAYEAEVYRAGIQAVPRGQMEAALSLGMSTRLALRRIVLPQAFRLALPSVTNDFIALLKDSSLVSVITVVELTKRMTITAVDTRGWVWPGLACAAMYFAMSYPLSKLAQRLEARMARG